MSSSLTRSLRSSSRGLPAKRDAGLARLERQLSRSVRMRDGGASSPHDYHIARCDRRHVGDCLLTSNGCRATRRRLGRVRRARLDRARRIRGMAADGLRAFREPIPVRRSDPSSYGRAMLAVTKLADGRLRVRSRATAVNRCAASWYGDTLTGACSPTASRPGGAFGSCVARRHSSSRRTTRCGPARCRTRSTPSRRTRLVFMKTRDGARLVSYVARPVGKGPFGVVLQRRHTRAFCIRPADTGRRAATSSSRSTCAAETSRMARTSATMTPTSAMDTMPWSGRRSCPARTASGTHRPLGRGTTRMVRRRECAAASRRDRAVGGDPAIRGASCRTRTWCSRRSTSTWACLMRARTLQNTS